MDWFLVFIGLCCGTFIYHALFDKKHDYGMAVEWCIAQFTALLAVYIVQPWN